MCAIYVACSLIAQYIADDLKNSLSGDINQTPDRDAIDKCCRRFSEFYE